MAFGKKSSQGAIINDPRYPLFLQMFQYNPLMFSVIVCGSLPSDDQESLLTQIAPPSAKVSVVSGTGTGKTYEFAIIAMWHFLCFPFCNDDGESLLRKKDTKIGSNTYIGAPRIKQVSDGVWKELNDIDVNIRGNPLYSWLADYYSITKTRVEMKGFPQWFISQVAMEKGQSIGVAGKHRYWQLIIVDEAAGVSDDHFNVIDGTQTQGGNRTLLASQGVRNAGHFYNTHHILNKQNGGSWGSLVFSSENSPHVTDQWLMDRLIETGGRNTVEYIVRVLGGFADASGSNLLTRQDLDTAFNAGKIIDEHEPYGIFILADVAMGEYRDESVAILAKVIGVEDDNRNNNARRVEYYAIPYCINSKDEVTFAGDLANLYGTLSNPTLLVDGGGIGATVIKLIEMSHVPVVKVLWGKPCFKNEYKERFTNRRACAMVRMRDAIRTGRVSFMFDCDQRMRTKIVEQGSRLPYHYVERGGLKYQMMSKDKMREEGISSPDIFDSMSFAFLEDARDYIVAEKSGMESYIDSSVNELLEAAKNAFSGV
jgi:hypothetical protein